MAQGSEGLLLLQRTGVPVLSSRVGQFTVPLIPIPGNPTSALECTCHTHTDTHTYCNNNNHNNIKVSCPGTGIRNCAHRRWSRQKSHKFSTSLVGVLRACQKGKRNTAQLSILTEIWDHWIHPSFTSEETEAQGG